MLLESGAAAHEPMDAIGVDLDDHVFQNPGSVVVRFLLFQVKRTAGTGDFDDQLGRAGQIAACVDVGVASQRCGDSQVVIRLWLALLKELGCGPSPPSTPGVFH